MEELKEIEDIEKEIKSKERKIKLKPKEQVKDEIKDLVEELTKDHIQKDFSKFAEVIDGLIINNMETFGSPIMLNHFANVQLKIQLTQLGIVK